MAYGFSKDKDEEAPDDSGAYSGMLDASMNSAPQMALSQAQGATQQAAQTADHTTGFGNGAGSPNQTASGYLNFGDFANANAGQAQGQANKLNQSTQSGAEAAQSALSSGVGTFENQSNQAIVPGSKASKTGGQVADEQRSTTLQNGSGASPRTVSVASGGGSGDNDGTKQGNDVQSSTSALSGASTRNGSPASEASDLAGANATLSGEGDRATGDQQAEDPLSHNYNPDIASAQETTRQAQENDPAYWAKMAGQTYGGPMGLQDSDPGGYEKLLDQTAGAQNQVNAIQAQHNGDVNSGVQASLGPGANKWDAAAVGAFGRPQFAQTGERYGKTSAQGDLHDRMAAAERGTSLMGTQARDTSAANAAGYGKLLGDYNTESGRLDADQKSAADTARADRDKTAGYQAKLDQFNKEGATTGAGLFRDLAETFDPTAWILKSQGQDTLEARANAGIEGAAGVEPGSQFSSSSGQVWNNHDPAQAQLYETMTDADWAEFNALPSEDAKKQWIEKHKGKGG